MRLPVLAALVLAAPLAAGCVGPGPGDATGAVGDAPSAGADGRLAPLGLAGASCLEGGGHSVHPVSLNPLPEPWLPADILGDVGPQLVYSEVPDPSYPVPTEGRTMGNYHATMWCESWTLDGAAREPLFFGFVGMRVQPPSFDAGPPASHHYVVTVIATDDEDVLARLQAAGIAAMRATATRETLADGTLRIQMRTDLNGDYDSLFSPKRMGEMAATRVRLWWQEGYAGHGGGEGPHEAHEDGYRPLALDLVTTRAGTHSVAEGQGYFSHTGNDHHAPAPGAYGHTAALMYEDFDRALEWGPRPDVRLEEAYVH